MRVIDPGHQYELATYDGDGTPETLTFVKRNDPPEKYPGNDSAYPGTLIQEVVRALLERVRYLDNQDYCPENTIIAGNLVQVLYLLESRAYRRHGGSDFANQIAIEDVEREEVCLICGHILCPHTD